MLFPIDHEDFSKALCSSWVATAIVGSSVIGAATTAYTANKAADAQTAANQNAANLQLQTAGNANSLLQGQYDTTRSDLQPYRDLGTNATGELTNRLQSLTTPIDVSQEQKDLQKPLTIDQATLESLPGYQFALQQGLKSTQNSAAARGLGVSGAALKGAATFTKGLADQTYNDYFNQQQSNVNNAFNRYQTVYQDKTQQQGAAYDRLKGLVDTGETAAAQTGALGTANVKQQSTNLTGAATGAAGNMVGAGNAQAGALTATGNAVSNAAANVGGYYAYKGLYGGGNAGVPNAPNLAFTKGIAGDQYVPTYG